MGLEEKIVDFIGSDIITTTADTVINWARKNSIWPVTMGLSCCAIEMMATGASRYDISRFGSEVFRGIPPSIGFDDCRRHINQKNGAGGS